VSYVSLSDEETRVIFAEEAAADFAALDASEQEEVITRLLNIVTSEAPPSSFIYERIANLDIITVGDQGADCTPKSLTKSHVETRSIMSSISSSSIRTTTTLTRRWQRTARVQRRKLRRSLRWSRCPMLSNTSRITMRSTKTISGICSHSVLWNLVLSGSTLTLAS